MASFALDTKLKPRGDQPSAVDALTKNLIAGVKDQVLFGVTGSGKTFTMANVIANTNKPTLVISHNKLLAWQLYQELKEFFPDNAVHYFVSYYDYYQPEAYIPQTDTYIAKDASINKKIDQMRHAAVQDLVTRKDVIVVASVSCIYNIGSPETYQSVSLSLKNGQPFTRKEFVLALIRLGFQRNDFDPAPGYFRAKANRIEVYPATGREKIIFEIENNTLTILGSPGDPRGGSRIAEIKLFPANFWISPENKLKIALANIRAELHERLKELKKASPPDGGLEAYRLNQKTNYDIELIENIGYCPGIENYSRHLDFRKPGEAPFTLINYFPKNFLTVIDESHMTIPQIRAMHRGDRARKDMLIKYGFRLPSAVDNRPLTFSEFEKRVGQTVYVSATPGPYELEKTKKLTKLKANEAIRIVEQIIRPTGLLDPVIEVRKTNNQMQDAVKEIENAKTKGQRTLVIALTKRLAEEIADYLKEEGLAVNYIHSDVHTLKRPGEMNKLREGIYDALVGINLLREGLDFPEVSLVIIFDADKEGFLRNETTLLQTIGRAARHVEGRAILYADTLTMSIKRTIAETKRRRKIQENYNKKYGITPKSVEKKIFALPDELDMQTDTETRGLLEEIDEMTKKEVEREMKKAAKELNFEKAAKLRDTLNKMKHASSK